MKNLKLTIESNKKSESRTDRKEYKRLEEEGCLLNEKRKSSTVGKWLMRMVGDNYERNKELTHKNERKKERKKKRKKKIDRQIDR